MSSKGQSPEVGMITALTNKSDLELLVREGGGIRKY